MDYLTKTIARAICIVTGSTKPYKRISRAFRQNKDGRGPKSNCFGSALCFLGEGSEEPRTVDWRDMQRFLEDRCIESREDNGIVVAFRAGDGELDHASVYFHTGGESVMIHQPDTGHEIRPSLLLCYLSKPDIASELEPEFYRPHSTIGQYQR